MKYKSKWFIILITVIICCLAAAFISACAVKDNGNNDNNGNNGGDNTQTEQPSTTEKKTYDMSSVVFDDLTVTYDGQAHSIEATNLPDGVTVDYEGNGKTTVGTYTVTAHFTGDSVNYNPIPDKTAALTISKATHDMGGVVFGDSTVTYDGQAHSILATNLPDGVTATYENNGKTEAGTYTITAHFAGDSVNYELIADKTATLMITKATYDISKVIFADLTVEYDGQEHSIYATNLPDGVTVTYEGNGKITVGTYIITAHFTGDSVNYNPIPDKTATLTISKATYDMSEVIFADLTVTYDGQPHSIEATNLPDGVTVEYENNGQIHIGNYDIIAKFTGDSTNYEPIPNKTAKLTIVPLELSGISLESESFVYDGTPKSIYISGNLPDDITVEYEGNDKSTVGEYTVTAKFTTTSDYEALPDLTATLTITKATYNMSGVIFNDLTVTYDGQPHSIEATNLPNGVTVAYEGNEQTTAGTYTVTAKFSGDSVNYNPIEDKTATLQIDKAIYDMSGVVFSDLTVTYDGQPHSITATNLPEGVTVAYEGNEQSTAGTYSITAKFSGDSVNYNAIPDKTAALTITKATYNMNGVVFANTTVTYNGEAHSIFAENLPEGVTVSYDGNDKITAGKYEITAHFFGDEVNYNAIPDKTATLKIDKATYDMSGVMFGDLTVEYDGQPHSIYATNLPDGVTVTYEGNEQTTAGTYTITAKFSGDSVNYNAIENKTATLKIDKATYDMSGVVFNSLSVEYDGTAKSIYISGDLPIGVTVTYEGNSQTEIGTHTVIVKFTGDSVNYNAIPDKTATLTITQPAKTEIESASGFEIDETDDITRLYREVPYTTQYVDISKDITVTVNCTWKLFKDFIGSIELTLKSMELTTGLNTAYIIVYAPNGDFVRYQVDIYRLDMKSYTFMNVGSEYSSGTVEEKSTVVAPTAPERTGYTFLGWAVQGSTDIVDFPYTVTEDIAFVAQYTPINYTITYHLNGGENDENNPDNYDIETATITLQPATREDYTFMGWFTDEQFETQKTTISVGSHGNIVLYAKWAYGTEGLTYSLSNSKYSVTGYKGTSTNVVIPAEWNDLPVTSIGSSAFSGCEIIINITIPDSVMSIGNSAFKNCTSLETVYWNATNCTSAGSLSYLIFDGCSALTTVVIGDDVQTIPSYTFRNRTSLETVYWNAANCTSAGSSSYSTFYGCSALTAVIFGDNVQTIPAYAFYNCTSLESITIPDSVTSIGSSAFMGCKSLESIIIPFVGATKNGTSNTHFGYIFGASSYSYNSSYVPSSLKSVVITGVTTIDNYAFNGCTGLTSVTIGNGVTSIGERAFYNCTSLESVTIPDNVTTIGNYAFYNCTSLETVYWNATNCTSAGSYSYPIFYGCSALTTVIIGENVQTIPAYAFYWCASLESVTIGSSVTSIGSEAFSDCTSLTSITIPDSVTSIGERAFYNCTSLESVAIGNSVTSIGGYAFSGCTSLESVAIGNSVISIGAYTFYGCNKITEIEIPDSVTTIGGHAFYNCTSLASVTIPDNVTSIGEYAFRGCSSLETVYWNAINCTKAGSDYYPIFNGCTALTTIIIGDNVRTIPAYAFYGCSKITEIEIPDSVTSIGEYAFRGCSSLESITIPESVTTIGDHAFSGCTSLVSITIPDSVTYIGLEAFFNCTSLKSVTIPDSVTSIGSHAFMDCTSLKSVTIGNGVTSIGVDAFDGCESLERLTVSGDNKTYHSAGDCIIETASGTLIVGCKNSVIPSDGSVTSIGYGAFAGCSGLTSITIPDSVTSIGNMAFAGCIGLTSIAIPDSVTSIGGYAFENCTSLETVYYGGTAEQWGKISIGSYNTSLTNATRYYFSEEYPLATKYPKATSGTTTKTAKS